MRYIYVAIMPSIFVWAATEPLKTSETSDTSDTLRYYSGSNWFLEERLDGISASYMYLDQYVLSHIDNEVLVYHAAAMPNNWVGSEVLDICNIPYSVIKEDSYGKLEQLGMWMRCTVPGTISQFASENEYKTIMKWKTTVHSTVSNRIPYNKMIKH